MKKNVFGDKLKRLRKEKGLTQIDLAEKIDVSFQQIQKYEKGETNITITRLYALAEALEIPVLAFFSERKSYDLADTEPTYNEKMEMVPFRVSEDEVVIIKTLRKINNKKIHEGLIRFLKGVLQETL